MIKAALAHFAVAWIVGIACCLSTAALGLTIDFEEFALPDGIHYDNGANGEGGFASRDVWLENHFTDYGGGCCWEGFALSSVANATQTGVANQFAAFAGSGASESEYYAMAYSGIDGGDSGLAPTIHLPAGSEPTSVAVTNSTWAALVMRDGDSNQIAKQFGGPSGNDPDYFQLRIIGLNAIDQPVGEVELYLADYRFADNSQDYILDTWQELDLTSLSGKGVEKLQIRLDSSDVNPMFGLNTPAYVAIDNLRLSSTTAGDYTGDGIVNLADYTRWRDTLAAPAVPVGSGADGNASGTVDAADYTLWKNQFSGSGAIELASQTPVPEPPAWLTAVLAVSLGVGHLKQFTITTFEQEN